MANFELSEGSLRLASQSILEISFVISYTYMLVWFSRLVLLRREICVWGIIWVKTTQKLPWAIKGLTRIIFGLP